MKMVDMMHYWTLVVFDLCCRLHTWKKNSAVVLLLLLWLWCLVMCNLEGVIVFCEGLRSLFLWIFYFFCLEWDSAVCLGL